MDGSGRLDEHQQEAISSLQVDLFQKKSFLAYE